MDRHITNKASSKCTEFVKGLDNYITEYLTTEEEGQTNCPARVTRAWRVSWPVLLRRSSLKL